MREIEDPEDINSKQVQIELDKKQYRKFLAHRTYKHDCEILRACCVLKPLQKVIIYLRYYDNDGRGYSFKQIAQRLHFTKAKIMREHNKAIERYRRWYMRKEFT